MTLDFNKLASTTAALTGEYQPKNSPPNDVRCINPAVKKQISLKKIQTVKHAKVIWDPKRKPRGLFGGHLNIRSIVSKTAVDSSTSELKLGLFVLI